jgi:hypothetical protein
MTVFHVGEGKKIVILGGFFLKNQSFVSQNNFFDFLFFDLKRRNNHLFFEVFFEVFKKKRTFDAIKKEFCDSNERVKSENRNYKIRNYSHVPACTRSPSPRFGHRLLDFDRFIRYFGLRAARRARISRH